MTPAFERDSFLAELDAQVLAGGEDHGRPFVVLSDTLFYPEGGGQPADRGWIGEIQVTGVRRVGKEIRHEVSAALSPGPVHLRLDWPRRFDHMQQHTGQHLLTAIAQDRFSWPTTAFHLGEDVSDIELDVRALGTQDLTDLEEAVAGEIRAARPVTARRVLAAEYAALPGVRTRGLPEEFSGSVRLVEIQGIDLNTCGGTHVASTAQLEALKLLGTEPMRGGTRLLFVAGGRLRRRMGAHEERNAALRDILGAPDPELPRAAAAKLDQLKRAEREVRVREEGWAEAVAESLIRRPGPVIAEHFPAASPSFLQRVAREFAQAASGKIGLFTAGSAEIGFFVLAGGPGFPGDVQRLGREVASLLEGRGGGSGSIAQGKIAAIHNREEALGVLIKSVQGLDAYRAERSG